MKKILVATIMLSLFATSAFALVSGSKHDMTLVDPGANTEICVYCHTPHGANTAVTLAPLWNRTVTTGSTAVYSGLALETTTSTQMTTTAIDASDAPLCMSCHDGTVAEVLFNEPNTAATGAIPDLTGNLIIDLDFSDDHPIAFNYSDAQGTDQELNAKTAVESALGAGAVSYGGGDAMWCSSCHDVHGAGFSAFLRVDNAGSALCTTCHAK